MVAKFKINWFSIKINMSNLQGSAKSYTVLPTPRHSSLEQIIKGDYAISQAKYQSHLLGKDMCKMPLMLAPDSQ